MQHLQVKQTFQNEVYVSQIVSYNKKDTSDIYMTYDMLTNEKCSQDYVLRLRRVVYCTWRTLVLQKSKLLQVGLAENGFDTNSEPEK